MVDNFAFEKKYSTVKLSLAQNPLFDKDNLEVPALCAVSRVIHTVWLSGSNRKSSQKSTASPRRRRAASSSARFSLTSAPPVLSALIVSCADASLRTCMSELCRCNPSTSSCGPMSTSFR